MIVSFYKRYIGINRRKVQKRGIDIFLYSFNNLSVPLFNFILSAILIKRISISFWGEFAAISLIVNFAVMIIGWGNKEFLLKEFSKNPSQISVHWQMSLIQRFIILLAVTCSFCFIFHYSFFKMLVILFLIVSSFLYKSLDVLVLFTKKFSFTFILEMIGYLMISVYTLFYSSEKITVDSLILLISLIMIFKFVVGIWYFHRDIFPVITGRSFFIKNTLFLALPFFLPGLTGFIQSKMDLYCVTYFLSKDQVGEYQIYMSLLSIPTILAAYVIMPFVKSLYRMSIESIKTVEMKLALVAAICSIPMMLCIMIIIQYYYSFHFSWEMYALGYIQMLPLFMYIIKIHLLFKFDKQKLVIWISIFTALVNFTGSIIFIPYWGIKGAIMASAITQWVTLLLFSKLTDRYIRAIK